MCDWPRSSSFQNSDLSHERQISGLVSLHALMENFPDMRKDVGSLTSEMKGLMHEAGRKFLKLEGTDPMMIRPSGSLIKSSLGISMLDGKDTLNPNSHF